MIFITTAIFILLSFIFYVFPIAQGVDLDLSRTFLTIATFLFAILAGFFISRQGQRYSRIRDQITRFDGAISAIYRFFGHLGKEAQNKAKDIIKNHYEIILNKNAWDWHFTHKSSTISLIHNLLEEKTKGDTLPSLKNFSVHRILNSLSVLQETRKKMVALHSERIPFFQWIIIYFLAAILIITIFTIPSHLFIIGALLKAAFASSVIFVVIMLHKFDSLIFFEGTIGEHSAQDILDIFSGKR